MHKLQFQVSRESVNLLEADMIQSRLVRGLLITTSILFVNSGSSVSQTKPRITTEEEAKAAIAERRRLAREEAERAAEELKRREEEERRLEEERLR